MPNGPTETESFPVATVTNVASATYTSDQTGAWIDATDLHSLWFGALVSSSGPPGVSFQMEGKGPDGEGYQLGRSDNNDRRKTNFIVSDQPIPAQIRINIALNGLASATLEYWVLGQA